MSEKQDALNREAERLASEGASGAAFEALRKQGWKSPSQLEGDGLEPCGPDCGVCHPPPFTSYRRRRR